MLLFTVERLALNCLNQDYNEKSRPLKSKPETGEQLGFSKSFIHIDVHEFSTNEFESSKKKYHKFKPSI